MHKAPGSLLELQDHGNVNCPFANEGGRLSYLTLWMLMRFDLL
jgi:hypothetical protein